jgi:hypothetical protein
VLVSRCSRVCDAFHVKTLGLSFLVAVGTLIAMAVAGLAFFTSGGIIFPTIVAWVSGSLFALSRRPRYLWLQVALLGVLVAASINFYFSVLPRLYPPPPGYMQGGPNVLPPRSDLLPPPPH